MGDNNVSCSGCTTRINDQERTFVVGSNVLLLGVWPKNSFELSSRGVLYTREYR